MQTRSIATVATSAIGLGGMPLSIEGRPDQERAVRTVHAALDAGIRFIDTADAYALDESEHGHNERLVATALASYGGSTDDVLVATKGGHRRPNGSWTVDGRPDYLRRACEDSLRALGVEAIGLYQYHRPDPRVPWAESIGALAELKEEGKIRLAGISNASVDQIRAAMDIVDLASVQNEFSPAFRDSEPELDFCADQGIAFLPWSPLGGIGSAEALARKHPAFGAVAEARGISPQRVCLAWLLAKAPVVVPIPGSTRPETIRDSAAAADLELTPDELARLDED